MNFRITAVLFGVAILLAAALLVTALFQDEPGKGGDGVLGPLTAAGVKADDVDTLELLRQPGDQKLVFRRTDKRWVATSPVMAQVNSAALDALVQDLFAAKPVPYSGLTDNLTTHGLNDPKLKVTVRKGDLVATVNVGTTLMGKDKAVTFVTTADRPNQPLAVKTTDLRGLFRDEDREKGGEANVLAKWLTDYRQKRLLTADLGNPGSDLDAVTVTRGDKTLALAHAADEWAFTAPADFGLADTAGDTLPSPDRFTGVVPLLNSLLTLQVNGPADYIENVPVEDLPKYGLAATDPAVIRVEVKSKKQPPEVLFVGKKVEKDGKPVVPARLYCRLDGDSAVATVSSNWLDALVNTVADPSAMRNRDLLAEAKRDRVEAIDSTFGGGFRLRRVTGTGEPQWALYGAATDPTDVQPNAVNGLLFALSRPRVATDTLRTPNDAAFADGQKAGELKLWVGGVDRKPPSADGKLPPEPQPKGDPITFTFGKAEGKDVFVRRAAGGRTTDFKVPAEVAAAVSKTRAAFIDPKLGSFNVASADRLVIFRKGVRTELKRESLTDTAYRGGKWVFEEPDADKGKPADGDAAATLIEVLAAVPFSANTRLVSEGASDDELKKLGLDPASPTASVTIGLSKEKEPQRVYHFGTEAADKSGVHFRLVGKPFVFVTDKAAADLVASADLTDKVLFRTATGRVKKLDLYGWRATAKDGKAVDVVLQLENGVWVAKQPEGATADPQRVAAILAALEAPKALATVPVEEGKLPPPECGFGENPLSIVAELEDGKTVQLRLGGEDKGKTGVYGQVNGKVYLLAPTALRPALEKPPLTGK